MKLNGSVWRQLAVAAALAASHAYAQTSHQRNAGPKPEPDYKDVKYGPYERNVVDFWKAKTRNAAPVLIYFHGGGFQQGDKSSVGSLMLARCLEAGISVAAANYRLSQQAPFPAPMLDGARAIQFLRYKAEAWNIDRDRIAANGGSAGAGISLWVGFHDDMADPASSDPVARQSTRLACLPVFHGQSSYDLRFIKEKIGGRAHEHPALLPFFGLKPDEVNTPRAFKLFEEASPINYVTADDPPVYLFYGEPWGKLPDNAEPGQGIHHPNFGVVLKQKLDSLGIECTLRHMDDFRKLGLSDAEIDQRRMAEVVAFMQKYFNKPRSRSR
jgi:acetyl esterase